MMNHPTTNYWLAQEKQRELNDEGRLTQRRHLREVETARRASHPALWDRIMANLVARQPARSRRSEEAPLIRSRERPRRAQPRNDGIFDRRIFDRGVLARFG